MVSTNKSTMAVLWPSTKLVPAKIAVAAAVVVVDAAVAAATVVAAAAVADAVVINRLVCDPSESN
jgi:hypothetical protein